MSTRRKADGTITEVSSPQLKLRLAVGLDMPGTLTLRFAEVDGRFALVRLEVGADFAHQRSDPVPITPGTLRALAPRLAPLVEAAARNYMANARMVLREMELSPDQRRQGRQAISAAQNAGARTGRRPLGRGHFEEVARAYTDAWRAGLDPTAEVASRFQIARSTAAHHVSRARNQYHLLPRTEQGRSRAKGARHGKS